MPRIHFDFRSASFPDWPYRLDVTAYPGEKLLDILAAIADKNSYVAEYILNLDEMRLYPYHIIFAEGELLIPRELDEYVIQDRDVVVKVIPFVSGG